VTSVALVGPGRTGISNYTDDLAEHLEESASVRRIDFDSESYDPIQFLSAAIRAGWTDDDVVHVQHEYGLFGPLALMTWVFFPVLFVLARSNRTSVVVTLHEAIDEAAINRPLVGLKRRYIRLMNRLLAAADAVVFLSPYAERRFLDGTNRQVNHHVRIPHGVNTRSAPSVPADRAKARFGYDAEDILIAEPGYIAPRKGSHVLLALAERLPECEFLLAGGPKPSQEDRAYVDRITASAPPNLQVTGRLENNRFHAVFSAADLVVLPYREVDTKGIINRISQSGILNRCMAHGVPVLAADYPYFRGLEAEWGCVKVVAGDADAMAARVRTLLEDDRERESIASAARAYAEDHRFERVARDHIELYESVASPVGARAFDGERSRTDD